MNWRKVSVYAVIGVSVLGVLVLAGWGLTRWLDEQLQVEDPQPPSPVATAAPPPTLTPGWWDSPLPVPTQPKK
jgi:hypothetical protein